MLEDFFNLFNFIVAIFCFVTSLFLFSRGIKRKYSILYLFSLYFLVDSISLFIIFGYSSIPDISSGILQELTFFAIFFAYLGIIMLLLSTFYLNNEISKNSIMIQIFISGLSMLVVLLLYPSNVTHYINDFPKLSILFASLIFISFLIPYGFCILNLKRSNINSVTNTINLEKNLAFFYILGIIITFTKILGFFEISIGSLVFNSSFMNIFAFLFIIQIFIIVYSLPANSSDRMIRMKRLPFQMNA